MITRTVFRPSTRSRRLTARLGWLMVAAVAIWALFGGAAFVGATHTAPLPLTLVDGDKDCPAGYEGWKIDNIDELHAGPYTFSNPDGTVTGSITFTGDDGTGQPTGYTNLVINPEPDEILVKQPQEGGGVSHITFCYAPVTETPTPTPTPVVTPTPTPVVTPTPTPVVTPTPTPVVTPTPTPTGTEVVATPTPTPVVTPTPPPVVTPTPTPVEETAGPATPTPTPVEAVAGATPTPVITPPATSTETPAGTPTQSGLLLVLLLLGMGTTGLLVFSPKRLRSR